MDISREVQSKQYRDRTCFFLEIFSRCIYFFFFKKNENKKRYTYIKMSSRCQKKIPTGMNDKVRIHFFTNHPLYTSILQCKLTEYQHREKRWEVEPYDDHLNHLPTNTPLHCMWDTEPITEERKRFSIPIAHVHKDNATKTVLLGIFCSCECAHAFDVKHFHNKNKHFILSLRKLMYGFPFDYPLYQAPPPTIFLQKYGGRLSREEYRTFYDPQSKLLRVLEQYIEPPTWQTTCTNFLLTDVIHHIDSSELKPFLIPPECATNQPIIRSYCGRAYQQIHLREGHLFKRRKVETAAASVATPTTNTKKIKTSESASPKPPGTTVYHQVVKHTCSNSVQIAAGRNLATITEPSLSTLSSTSSSSPLPSPKKHSVTSPSTPPVYFSSKRKSLSMLIS